MLPMFQQGTTVGDRDRLYRTVEESKVVAFLAAMEIMAEQFPGAFSGYNLQIQMIRDPKQQIEMMGVVEEHLSGHACHLYHLTSPDQTIMFAADRYTRRELFVAKKVKSKAEK
ncbi:4-hydroxy-tetrahydrodipicolinate reductase 2, chloroplastic-like [Gossypium raimondii]|uniref:4-hydroxy-tetrahydrodipicolinate reductase 2, chloroplastic-like n=1 Tax=Gossypium raimondii TaxID=29730 RepID=UPI00227A7ECA|nr:4-hydroxy-tetrahydrodipicolinate reductase 2, chloroplastic-like [Gossypium raimondii]